MHPIIPQAVGILAVVFFLLSYQCKRRRSIVFINTLARVLYVLQYLLLGEPAGAALDVLGALSAFVAGYKTTPFLKKHWLVVLPIIDIAIIAVGLLLYEEPYHLLPIIGVLIHTTALWLTKEKRIRALSIMGSPFWMVFNLICRAYGAAAVYLISMISIFIAMIKYGDFKKPIPEKETETNEPA